MTSKGVLIPKCAGAVAGAVGDDVTGAYQNVRVEPRDDGKGVRLVATDGYVMVVADYATPSMEDFPKVPGQSVEGGEVGLVPGEVLDKACKRVDKKSARTLPILGYVAYVNDGENSQLLTSDLETPSVTTVPKVDVVKFPKYENVMPKGEVLCEVVLRVDNLISLLTTMKKACGDQKWDSGSLVVQVFKGVEEAGEVKVSRGPVKVKMVEEGVEVVGLIMPRN